MTTAITTLRSTIAAALENPTQWQVSPFVPAAVQANTVYISWDDPMLTPNNNQIAALGALANFKLTMLVPLLDNQGALENLENFIVGIYNKLSASHIVFNVGSVSAPTVAPEDQGQMLLAEMSISTLTTWSES